MTCIVAIAADGKVYMGADSCGSDGFRRYVVDEQKIVRKGELLLGVSGSFRFIQLLHHVWDPPQRLAVSSDRRYMCVEVANSIRTLLRDNGLLQKKEDVEQAHNCWACIGYRGSIWSFEPDLQMRVDTHGYAATGSGMDHAHGALHATRTMEGDPLVRLELALEAAAAHVVTVCAPFHFETL